MSSEYSIKKPFDLLISIGLPLLCLFFFGDRTLVYAMVLFGQAHFLITYIYTQKARGIDRRYIAKLCALLLILTPLCFLVVRYRNLLPWLILCTATLFVIHYINDEFKIAGIKDFQYKGLALLSITLSYIMAFTSKLFVAERPLLPVLCTISLALFLLFTYFFFHHKQQGTTSTFLFLLANVLVPSVLAFTNTLSVQQLLGFIVLFHYVRWYLYYFQKFTGEELTYYWDMILWCHIFVTIVFVQFILAPHTGIPPLFFSPTFFYGWTIIHILLSVRKSDYIST